MELGGFGVDRIEKRAQWEESLDAITRMFVEEPFAGYEGRWISMPPRNVVPKPRQRPHPPLWVACSRRETILTAAQRGLGALSFAFVEPEAAKEWVDSYYELIASDRCVPAGFAVNPNVAVRAADDVPSRRGDGDRARHRRSPLLRLLARLLLRVRRAPSRPLEPVAGVRGSSRGGGLRSRDRHTRRRAARRPAAAGGPGKPARGDRDPGPGRGPDRALRGVRRRPGHLRLTGRREPSRTHLREPGAVRRRCPAPVRRAGPRARARKERAPRGRGGAGAGAPRAPAGGRSGLCRASPTASQRRPKRTCTGRAETALPSAGSRRASWPRAPERRLSRGWFAVAATSSSTASSTVGPGWR